ncbi:MAG: YibE/F family protein [bacterium]
MFRKIFIISLVIFSGLPFFTKAGDDKIGGNEEIIEAEVVEIIEEREIEREDGSKNIQQNIRLKGLNGEWDGKEFIFEGISNFDVVSSKKYGKGDKVIVSHHQDMDGKDMFYITDYVRRRGLYLLSLIFVMVIVIVAGFKGLRALLSLFLSFIIIMFYIIPKILAGSNPLSISIIGSVLILTGIIYLTEGLNRRSNLAVVSILASLAITGALAIFFTSLTRLGGMAGEEAMFLIGFSKTPINFEGLLLAGIIIGTLGVLDDAVISQLATVEEIRKAGSLISKRDLFRKSFGVGVSHISSMTNTLFLAYAGASLPLLLLFSIKQPPFLSFTQIINNEMIATEIVRALVGSVGLVLVVPIATFLGVEFGE